MGGASEPRLLNCCGARGSVGWVLVSESVVHLVGLGLGVFQLARGRREAERLGRAEEWVGSGEFWSGGALVLAALLGTAASALLARAAGTESGRLLLPYMAWKVLAIVLAFPALVALSFLLLWGEACGQGQPRPAASLAGGLHCGALSLETLLLALFICLSVPYLLYAALLRGYFRSLRRADLLAHSFAPHVYRGAPPRPPPQSFYGASYGPAWPPPPAPYPAYFYPPPQGPAKATHYGAYGASQRPSSYPSFGTLSTRLLSPASAGNSFEDHAYRGSPVGYYYG